MYEILLGKERDRWSPEARFIEAAHNGDVGKIKKIAKELDVHGHGIPVTVANTTYMGMNALHAAAGCGSFSVFQYLVEEVKMDVDLPDTAQQFTPVAHAVTNGNLPAVKYLIDHGADLHQQRAKGNITLLHAAAVHGYSEIVKFLLARGADVNAVSDLGTALTDAAIRGFPSIVKTHLEHNADPNKASCQFGLLSMALQISSVSYVKLLIQGGANVSGDSPRDNLLVKAAEKGLTEAIKCLLEAGANPNVPNTFGRLPIELAAEYGTREDVEILFPFTSPISTVANWSVDGIISHVKMEIKQLEDDNFVKERVSGLKRQADEAFKKQDYLNASVLYTQALKMDNFDAKLLSNRSLCWLRMGDGQRAFDDATKCKRLRPKWAKAHYRQGAALMFMKKYAAAYSALSRDLELDPQSEETEKLFWIQPSSLFPVPGHRPPAALPPTPPPSGLLPCSALPSGHGLGVILPNAHAHAPPSNPPLHKEEEQGGREGAAGRRLRLPELKKCQRKLQAEQFWPRCSMPVQNPYKTSSPL